MIEIREVAMRICATTLQGARALSLLLLLLFMFLLLLLLLLLFLSLLGLVLLVFLFLFSTILKLFFFYFVVVSVDFLVFVIADVAIDSGTVVDDGLYILLQLLILLFFKFCFLILSFLFDKTK